MESLLAFPWPPCFSLHLDEEHLMITDPKTKQVEEPIRQALDDVLSIHAEKLARIGSEDLAAVFGQGHHGELLDV